MRTGFATPGAGGFDFIGIRERRGVREIVYDDGVARRRVWRVVRGPEEEEELDVAISRAAQHLQVLPALYAELRKRSIVIEAVSG